MLKLVPLTMGTFAVGTGLLVIQGVLPAIAADFAVSTAAAGQLVSVFALTYALGAPVLATAAARFGTRPMLVTALVTFAAASTLSALAPTFGVLLGSRVLAALGAALFTPIASAAAGLLVEPAARGRALALVYGGLSIAMVLGVPVGTLLGQAAGWRSTFWLVAGLAAVALVALIAVVPALPTVPAPGPRAVVAIARRPAVLGALVVMAVMTTGQFVVYTFVAPLATLVTGRTDLVAVSLFVFGVFAVIGNFVGGAVTDRLGAPRTLRLDLALFVVAFGLLWAAVLVAPSPLALVPGVLGLALWGVTGWGFNPPQQRRLFDLEPGAAGVVLAANASALYLGIAAGSAAGAAVYTAAGAPTLPPTGVALIAVALLLQLRLGGRTGSAAHPPKIRAAGAEEPG